MSKDAKNNEWNVQINVEIFAKKKQDRADDIFGAYTLCGDGVLRLRYRA